MNRLGTLGVGRLRRLFFWASWGTMARYSDWRQLTATARLLRRVRYINPLVASHLAAYGKGFPVPASAPPGNGP